MSLPAHLTGHQPMGLQLGQTVAQFELGSQKNFIYLVLCWKTKKAAIVDPQKDLDPPLTALRTHGFQLDSILLTHTHFDHTAGVPELTAKYPQMPVYVHGKDAFRLNSLIKDQGP